MFEKHLSKKIFDAKGEKGECIHVLRLYFFLIICSNFEEGKGAEMGGVGLFTYHL